MRLLFTDRLLQIRGDFDEERFEAIRQAVDPKNAALVASERSGRTPVGRLRAAEFIGTMRYTYPQYKSAVVDLVVCDGRSYNSTQVFLQNVLLALPCLSILARIHDENVRSTRLQMGVKA